MKVLFRGESYGSGESSEKEFVAGFAGNAESRAVLCENLCKGEQRAGPNEAALARCRALEFEQEAKRPLNCLEWSIGCELSGNVLFKKSTDRVREDIRVNRSCFEQRHKSLNFMSESIGFGVKGGRETTTSAAPGFEVQATFRREFLREW
jgi:hypothetical protein